MQWSFKPAFGKPIFVNGTVQDIRKSAEYTETMQFDSNRQGARSMASEQERGVAKDTISVQFCGVFPMANSQHMSAQALAIVKISGPAVIGPGPRNCAQVSCANNSAIWWCNDVGHQFGLVEFPVISTQQVMWLTMCSAIPQSCFLEEWSNFATQ